MRAISIRAARAWAPAMALALIGGAVQAQVVREEGVKTIAGVLGGLEADAYDDFTFDSAGDEVLVVSVDRAVYQPPGGEADEDGAAAEPGGGCGGSGGDCGGDDGGCGGEGGPVGLCLQVLDAGWRVLCWATRPTQPGWQRDPRLICSLPAVHGKPERYTVRVALGDELCSDLLYPDPEGDEPVPYLLSVSLRQVAPEGPLSRAVALSKNRF